MSSGSIRVSDADRDKVAEVLHAAYAEGRIDDEEHGERLEATLVAKTFDDLLPLTADLLPAPPFSVPRPATPPVQARSGQPGQLTAVLSETKKVGVWHLGQRTNVNVVMGSMHLDLTEAVVDGPVIEVNLTQLMGSFLLRVPTGATIRVESGNVLGETSVKGLGQPDPNGLTVVLRGVNILGEVKVRGPKKPSMWRRALT
ncbi:MAG TPA: DUF1707 domain-containing protein [Propionibacteriaceae bacterium]